ncbi:MAG: radical SAM protein [Alphaproteobacteria bacterium]|nr:radical SAM protein [Alphaproteobacteria bacterium]
MTATAAAALPAALTRAKPLDPAKFRDPDVTARGERRASVALTALRTLWLNTGTLCNLACRNCYIESSPTNDRLAYLSAAEARGFLDEIAATGLPTEEIGFTGGEPFMNPDLPAMLEDALARGFRVLVLTNAMRPMLKQAEALLGLNARFGAQLTLRVSIDHYAEALHQVERGPRSWGPTMQGLDFLVRHGFSVRVAGRTVWGEDEAALRQGYQRLFDQRGVKLDAGDPAHLVLFPEMDAGADVPEITTACWGILGRSPDAMMCASARMVVKRKDAERPAVVACTLLPYDRQFELGATLAEAAGAVKLNHPHCAKFCVLGGASCSAG